MKYIKNLVIILRLVFIFSLLLMFVLTFDNKDTCLDTGFCKEGIEVNTSKGKIIVNKQTCAENNGIWITRKNLCKFEK